MFRWMALITIVAANAAAQCVMCSRTAAAQAVERARFLNLGIVIILVPVVAIFLGFMYLAWRRRHAE